MAFVYFPHGAVMNQWTPKTEGPDFDLPPIIAPLKPFQNQLTIISGLENKSAIAAPVHAITPGTWLSCVPPRISHDPLGGITIDQIAAKHIGQDTPLPSLEVGTEERGGEGSCDRNYGCSYGKTISFRDPVDAAAHGTQSAQAVPAAVRAGGHDRRARAAVASRAAAFSIWYRATPRICSARWARATRRCSMTISRRCARSSVACSRLEGRDLSKVSLPDAPAGIPSKFDEHIRLMFDMIALAYQANLTRVVSFMMAAEVSNQPYNFIGISDAFHPLSHHANNPHEARAPREGAGLEHGASSRSSCRS